jgi:hypothetical protein
VIILSFYLCSDSIPCECQCQVNVIRESVVGGKAGSRSIPRYRAANRRAFQTIQNTHERQASVSATGVFDRKSSLLTALRYLANIVQYESAASQNGCIIGSNC